MNPDNKLVERVPFNDLSLQWREIAEQAKLDLDEVFATSAFCLGPQVESFECEIAEFLGVAHHGRLEYRPRR
jgi:dTDP-4-amino-4,6-dideoxygalactose transaminase